MKSRVSRFQSVLLLAVALLFSSTASAGIIIDWDFEAVIGYSLPASDLVVTFQLVEASTGRVIYQVDNANLTVVNNGNELVYSYSVEVDHSAYDTDYRWSLVVDATNANSTCTVDEWKQVVDGTTTYSASTSNSDIKGTIATVRFIGEYSEDFIP